MSKIPNTRLSGDKFIQCNLFFDCCLGGPSALIPVYTLCIPALSQSTELKVLTTS